MTGSIDNPLLRLIVFPGAWLVAVMAICGLRLDLPVWIPLAFVIACIGYFFKARARYGYKSNRRDPVLLRITAHAGLVVLMFVISAFVPLSYKWLTWDPDGRAQGAAWGSPACDTSSIAIVPNGAGMVAQVRRTDCSIGIYNSGDSTYYVYIHTLGEDGNRQNLVLRYDITQVDRQPVIHWQGASVLEVAVGPRAILQVTEMREFMNGVHVKYSLAPAQYRAALTPWQRYVNQLTTFFE